MQYMMLCCFDPDGWRALPQQRRDAVMSDYGAWIEEMQRLGKHRATGKLASPSSAQTLRFQGGRRQVVDGPFAETKEQLGGYHVLECRDLEEALSLAERIPTLPHGGAVEVRALEPAA